MSSPSSDLSLDAISNRAADLLDGVAPRLVAIHGPRRRSSTGIIWRPGLVLTAEETLEADEDILLTRPDGSRAPASLVGRDPSTDIALLRTEERPIAEVPFRETSGLRVGHLVLAAGRQPDGLSAALGIVALAGGPWRSLRGGHIDRRLHLDLRLDARSEGGAALDVSGEIIGMTVLGPRGRVLVIPSETIERVAQQLLEHGRIARGYLGLGLQPVSIDQTIADAAGLAEPRGLIVISVDSNGPGQKAGIKQGDVLIRWNADPLYSVRRVYALLGPESVGQSVVLGMLRSGKQISLTVEIAERSNPQE
ncbi:LuxR family transcriptional regulator [Microvirga sp. KLBC 81]|uniref:S1C family serine protease n=1 Tax=Microvirga sp. KLBC 81 TaxID=1862707 RepID=UPI000D51007A|nr:S1C family serine protease [Microvirga sp. KLBC 81]PVE25159.1 LuxR family transcriptional regulator [Microvirga sp. KLBC 81]